MEKKRNRGNCIFLSEYIDSLLRLERFFHESTKCRDFLAIIRRGEEETRREPEVSIENNLFLCSRFVDSKSSYFFFSPFEKLLPFVSDGEEFCTIYSNFIYLF